MQPVCSGNFHVTIKGYADTRGKALDGHIATCRGLQPICTANKWEQQLVQADGALLHFTPSSCVPVKFALQTEQAFGQDF